MEPLPWRLFGHSSVWERGLRWVCVIFLFDLSCILILLSVDLDIEGGTSSGYPAFVNEIRSLSSGANKQYVGTLNHEFYAFYSFLTGTILPPLLNVYSQTPRWEVSSTQPTLMPFTVSSTLRQVLRASIIRVHSSGRT